MKVYLIKSASRLRTLSLILNNYFQWPENSTTLRAGSYYLYLSNYEGQSILEISPDEEGYRHATYHDHNGKLPVPLSHQQEADFLFALPQDQKTNFLEAFKRSGDWAALRAL